MPDLPINIDQARLADFCRRWSISQLSIFGSVLRTDFRPDSDVDVLVTFAPNSTVSYWDWPAIQEDLQELFGRRIDLVEKKSVTNPFMRHSILSTHRVLYAA